MAIGNQKKKPAAQFDEELLGYLNVSIINSRGELIKMPKGIALTGESKLVKAILAQAGKELKLVGHVNVIASEEADDDKYDF